MVERYAILRGNPSIVVMNNVSLFDRKESKRLEQGASPMRASAREVVWVVTNESAWSNVELDDPTFQFSAIERGVSDACRAPAPTRVCSLNVVGKHAAPWDSIELQSDGS